MIVKGVAQQGKLAMQTWCHIWVDFAVGSHPGSQFASFYPQQKKNKFKYLESGNEETF